MARLPQLGLPALLRARLELGDVLGQVAVGRAPRAAALADFAELRPRCREVALHQQRLAHVGAGVDVVGIDGQRAL